MSLKTIDDQRSSRSPATTPRPWTEEDEQKLRTLKGDQKAKHAWKVIAGKLAHSEPKGKAKWNQIKNSS
jgi:hypothetical protein